MSGFFSWVTANGGAIAGAMYGLALLGSHAADHTIVYKISKWILSGGIVKPPQ